MELTRLLELPETMQAPVAVVQHTNSALLTALAFTFFGLILVVHTRLQRQSRDRQSSETITVLAGLADNIATMENRMQQIDRGLQRLAQRFDQAQLAQINKEGFLQARSLAREGASAKQIIDLCGLTRGEAELFQRLHS